MEVAEAAKWADVMMMLTPDELQGDIYRDHLHANMKNGAALLFAHGLNVHFNLLEPRADLDVLMIAPKGPGHTVRAEYARGAGVPCLMAIAQDATGNAHVESRILQLLGGFLRVLGQNLWNGMGEFVFARIDLLSQSFNLFQLLAPQFVDFFVECQNIPCLGITFAIDEQRL